MSTLLILIVLYGRPSLYHSRIIPTYLPSHLLLDCARLSGSQRLVICLVMGQLSGGVNKELLRNRLLTKMHYAMVSASNFTQMAL